MRLVASLSGDLSRMMREEVRGLEAAAQSSVAEATEGLKRELRGQVTSAGLGRRLANTWRAEVYPKGGRSLRAAGLVYTRAPNILRAFEDGAVIRSRDGLWLAIPTEAAPRRGVGGKRISPSNFPEHALGKLRFVYRPGRASLLVVDDLRASPSTGSGRKRGGFRRASATALRTGRGLASVVMFVLVPQVRLRKRLDVAGAAAAAHERLFGDLARSLVE